MVSAGEVSLERRISSHPAIKNSLEELSLELGNGDLRGRRKAMPLLVCMVRSMEALVLDLACSRYMRAFAFCKLMKLGVLTF